MPMNPLIHAAFNTELELAKQLIASGNLERAYTHIERAHVIGQNSVVLHARSHWLFLRLELIRSRPLAAWGQVMRIMLGVLGSALNVVPVGNTGGSDISMFKRLPVAVELQNIIDDAFHMNINNSKEN
jgi:hypothetical protein